MKNLVPLIPFVAALSLLACQGSDGPVADGAAPPDDSVVVPSGSFANAAAAKADARAAAAAQIDDGMGWASADGGASFGPRGARALLTFACKDKSLSITRLHPATPGATGTLSFTGGGTGSSVPMRAIAKPGGPGESEWRGEASGDMARAVARAFAGQAPVEVTLGGAPALVVPSSPVLAAVLRRCAA